MTTDPDWHFLALWHFGILSFWHFGILAFWHCGILAFWHFGIVAFWHCGIVAFWHYGKLWHLVLASLLFTTKRVFVQTERLKGPQLANAGRNFACQNQADHTTQSHTKEEGGIGGNWGWHCKQKTVEQTCQLVVLKCKCAQTRQFPDF